MKEQRESKDKQMDILGLKGQNPGQRDTLYDKIQSQQRRWKVLDEDSDDGGLRIASADEEEDFEVASQ